MEKLHLLLFLIIEILLLSIVKNAEAKSEWIWNRKTKNSVKNFNETQSRNSYEYNEILQNLERPVISNKMQEIFNNAYLTPKPIPVYNPPKDDYSETDKVYKNIKNSNSQPEKNYDQIHIHKHVHIYKRPGLKPVKEILPIPVAPSIIPGKTPGTCICLPRHQCKSQNLYAHPQFDPRSSISEILSNSTSFNESSATDEKESSNRNTRSLLDGIDDHHEKFDYDLDDYDYENENINTNCGLDEVCCQPGDILSRHVSEKCSLNLSSVYPWQTQIAQLKDNGQGKFICSGVLIQQNYMVTAAHCIKNLNVKDLRIYVGNWSIGSTVFDSLQFTASIEKVTIHPNYYAGNFKNDIAVIKIASNNNLNSYGLPLSCLSTQSTFEKSAECLVTGWGMEPDGVYSGKLKRIELNLMERKLCENRLRTTSLGDSFVLDNGMVCAGGDYGIDSCLGDGGGPLMCKNGEHTQLTGLVSWGVGCGEKDTPGVYVNIGYYSQWIKSLIV